MGSCCFREPHFFITLEYFEIGCQKTKTLWVQKPRLLSRDNFQEVLSQSASDIKIPDYVKRDISEGRFSLNKKPWNESTLDNLESNKLLIQVDKPYRLPENEEF